MLLTRWYGFQVTTRLKGGAEYMQSPRSLCILYMNTGSCHCHDNLMYRQNLFILLYKGMKLYIPIS